MNDLKITKIKVQYNKKGKKVRLSEIVSATCDYCKELINYGKGNLSLTEQMVYNTFKPLEVKDNILNSYSEYKHGKITKEEAANEILDGKCVSNSSAQSSFRNFTNKLAALIPVVFKIKEQIINKKKELNKSDLDLSDIDNNLEKVFKELFNQFNIPQSEENKEFILKNINDIYNQINSSASKINQNLKINLLARDLSYIASNKQRTLNKKALKLMRETVGDCAKAANDLVKISNTEYNKDKFKFNTVEYYTNRLKGTILHVETVFYMIIKDMKKLDKLINSINNSDSKNSILKTEQKKKFDERLMEIEDFLNRIKKGEIKFIDNNN